MDIDLPIAVLEPQDQMDFLLLKPLFGGGSLYWRLTRIFVLQRAQNLATPGIYCR